MDGKREIMDLHDLLTLSQDDAWRNQLAALQGHVAPHRVERGVYRATEDVIRT